MKFLTSLSLLLALASSAWSQGAVALLYELDQVLTNHCDSGPEDCIADGTPIYIFWDNNSNGPDPSDPLVPLCSMPPDCESGPAGSANYNQFEINGARQGIGCGLFFADAAFVTIGLVPIPPRYYLRVNGTQAAWTSHVFTLIAGPQDVDPTWYPCVPLPGCDPTNLNVTLSVPGSLCLGFCPIQTAAHITVNCPETQIPVVTLTSGCTDCGNPDCIPAEAFITTTEYVGGAWVITIVANNVTPIGSCACFTWTGCTPPPCDFTEIIEISGAGYFAPVSVCADVCAGSVADIISSGVGGTRMNPLYPPLIYFLPGCNLITSFCDVPSCPPGQAYIGNSTYDESTGFFHTPFYGQETGCVCITEEILPAEFGEFTAIPGDSKVRLNWNTLSETDVDFFDLSRASGDHPATSIAHIPGQNSSSGHAYSWTDENAINGTTYTYSLTTVNLDGSRDEHDQTVQATPLHNLSIASEFALFQNYPNPFNGQTTIEFDLAEQSEITLSVFDIQGRFVKTLATGDYAQGHHTLKAEFNNQPSGIYFYTLTSPAHTRTQKLLLLK